MEDLCRGITRRSDAASWSPFPLLADGDGDDVAFEILENFGWRSYEHRETQTTPKFI